MRGAGAGGCGAGSDDAIALKCSAAARQGDLNYPEFLIGRTQRRALLLSDLYPHPHCTRRDTCVRSGCRHGIRRPIDAA